MIYAHPLHPLYRFLFLPLTLFDPVIYSLHDQATRPTDLKDIETTIMALVIIIQASCIFKFTMSPSRNILYSPLYVLASSLHRHAL